MQVTLQTAQHKLMQAMLQHFPEHKVYEDGDEGVGVYAMPDRINTAYNTILEQLEATDVQGLAELATADGTEDMTVEFVLFGHNMYLCTCYDSSED